VRSPLRHIPGPWPAKLSSAWLIAIECTGRRAFYIRSLHQRYGPVVRIGPAALSFASAAAARDIYVGVDVVAAAEPPPHPNTPARPSCDGGSSSSRYGTVNGGDQTAPATTAAALATAERKTAVKTFPKAPIYELAPKNLGFMTDEAEHREHHWRVGHCFEPARRRRRRLHWFCMFTLDTSGAAFSCQPVFFADRSPTLCPYRGASV
jgi:hypothetical protein